MKEQLQLFPDDLQVKRDRQVIWGLQSSSRKYKAWDTTCPLCKLPMRISRNRIIQRHGPHGKPCPTTGQSEYLYHIQWEQDCFVKKDILERWLTLGGSIVSEASTELLFLNRTLQNIYQVRPERFALYAPVKGK